MSRANEVFFMPLGGVGEIGMNLALYATGEGADRRYIMIDCGISFAGPDLPGIDIVTADIQFIADRRDKLDGIIITHAHEDHIGGLLYLWDELRAPVFLSEFAEALLRAKKGSDPVLERVPFRRFHPMKAFTVGRFDVTPIPVSHSIPESHSLLLEAAGRRLVHTGDWKLDAEPVLGEATSLKAFQALADLGPIDAVVSDSTNAMREGESPTEKEVGRALANVIANAQQRVFVTLFSSNVARIKSVLDAAREAGRTVVLAGRALDRVVSVGEDLGLLTNLPSLADMRSFDRLARQDVLVLLTGSQGESRAALSRVSEHDHPHLSVTKGDTVVFSSRIIPGNERAVLRVMNNLAASGVELITDSEAPIHVSGHPRRPELLKLYEALKPRTVVPVHGEPRHLKAHAQLAREAGYGAVLMMNGDMLSLGPKEDEIVDGIEPAIFVQDGDLLLAPAESGVFERRSLADRGVVTVAFALLNGKLVSDIEVIVDGLPDSLDGDDAETFVLSAVSRSLRALPMPRRRDIDAVADSIRKSVRNAVGDVWGKRPIAHIHAIEIDRSTS
ncbi:MAG: ribonuclease J [Pseudomonadota bacterium]